jgi:hypothetical protein
MVSRENLGVPTRAQLDCYHIANACRYTYMRQTVLYFLGVGHRQLTVSQCPFV